ACGALDQVASRFGEGEERCPAVVRVRLAQHQSVAHQALGGARHAGRVHLQAGDDARQRQRARPAERQQAQHLVPGEGHPEWLQRGIHPRQQQLLGAHHRRDHRHALCGIRPAVGDPLALGFGERVDRERARACHGSTVSGARPVLRHLARPFEKLSIISSGTQFHHSAQVGSVSARGGSMKIYVLVKEVPDTYGDRKLDLETGLADRAAGDVVLDEITERALEVALSYADKNADTEVVALSMSPESSTASVRRALAIGAGSAVHIVDEQLRGADLGLTAATLAAAIRRGEPDLVITGNLSTDGSGGVIPAMLAEHLGYAQATALSAVEITADGVSGTRAADDGAQQVSASLPAVIS